MDGVAALIKLVTNTVITPNRFETLVYKFNLNNLEIACLCTITYPLIFMICAFEKLVSL
jgi:hypothetical protein